MINSEQKSELVAALQSDDVSMRLQAALAIGMNPQPEFLDVLFERCSAEPDFGVREQLTWSIIRFPKETVVPKLVSEVSLSNNQARSQALHTLSKIDGADAWGVITKELLNDPCDDVAQAAWRAAVTLVPARDKRGLAEDLCMLLGRGGKEVERSLSLSLVALGEEIVGPILNVAAESKDKKVQRHALFTRNIFADSAVGSEYAVDQVKLLLAPRPKE